MNDPKIVVLSSEIRRGNLFASCSRQNHSAAKLYFGTAEINLIQFSVKVQLCIILSAVIISIKKKKNCKSALVKL